MKKYIAQVPYLRFAKLIASQFNGFVEEKVIDGKTMFVVYFFN